MVPLKAKKLATNALIFFKKINVFTTEYLVNSIRLIILLIKIHIEINIFFAFKFFFYNVDVCIIFP